MLKVFQAVVLLSLAVAGFAETRIHQALEAGAGRIQLPAGVIEVTREITVPEGVTDLEIVGAPEGTTLRAADTFEGRAVLVLRGSSNVLLHGFVIDGNRAALERPIEMAPSDVAFADFYPSNGVLADDVEGLTIREVEFRNIANFAVLIARSSDVEITGVDVIDSGSHDENGRNNTSGGILIEEGTSGFIVRGSRFENVLGNGVWTHSMYTSPRNRDGVIAGNSFENLARDAIQVGHATNVRVSDNSGSRIGYPVEAIDIERQGTPVAIDTAGNVDRTVYAGNRFEEINGKCIDLDGFHHGEVRDNVCINTGSADDYPYGHYGIVMNNSNPDMVSEEIVIEDNVIDGTKFGGIFVIGSGHRVTGNRLLNLNKAGCNENAAKYGCTYFPGEPDLLRSGVYLGRGAARPSLSTENIVEDNVITGHGMATWCIGWAPGVTKDTNQVGDNDCRNGGGE